MKTLELDGMNLAEGPSAGSWTSRAADGLWTGLKQSPNRFAARVLLAVWGAFWTWFCVMDGLSEGLSSLVPVASVLAGVGTMVLVGFRWPRLAGPVLLAGAGVSAWVFQGGAAWLLFSAPLAVAGLLIPWERR